MYILFCKYKWWKTSRTFKIKYLRDCTQVHTFKYHPGGQIYCFLLSEMAASRLNRAISLPTPFCIFFCNAGLYPRKNKSSKWTKNGARKRAIRSGMLKGVMGRDNNKTNLQQDYPKGQESVFRARRVHRIARATQRRAGRQP